MMKFLFRDPRSFSFSTEMSQENTSRLFIMVNCMYNIIVSVITKPTTSPANVEAFHHFRSFVRRGSPVSRTEVPTITLIVAKAKSMETIIRHTTKSRGALILRIASTSGKFQFFSSAPHATDRHSKYGDLCATKLLCHRHLFATSFALVVQRLTLLLVSALAAADDRKPASASAQDHSVTRSGSRDACSKRSVRNGG